MGLEWRDAEERGDGEQSVEFVTSVSRAYLERHGLELLNSLVRHGPSDARIRLYCDASGEGCSLDDYALPSALETRVCRVDLFAVTTVGEYVERNRACVEGRIGPVAADPDVRRRSPRYNYRWDALTFGRKGFSLAHALLTTRAAYTFWVDSDLVVVKDITAEVLCRLFGRRASIVFFGRKGTHTETGFLGFRSSRECVREFARSYLTMWESGGVFRLSSGWTDCDVFDAVLNKMVADGKLEVRNLSRYPRGHVIATSSLGEFLQHRKGHRKARRLPPPGERCIEICREMLKGTLDGLGILRGVSVLGARMRRGRQS